MFFLTIYIKEAHAVDEWKLGNRICIKQHKTIEERKSAALQMINDLKLEIPTFLDTIDNSFEELFCIWPERYIILDPKKGNEIVFISAPETVGVTVHQPYHLEEAIKNYLQ
ncbi:hypothetical protein ABK040_016714 [Willaertia magna]